MNSPQDIECIFSTARAMIWDYMYNTIYGINGNSDISCEDDVISCIHDKCIPQFNMILVAF